MPLPEANSGKIEVASGSDLRYGGKVSFDFSYDGRLKNPRVYMEAHQDGKLVHGEAGLADQVFPLGPPSFSQWVINGGGAAECVGTLFYFAKAGGKSEWTGSGQQEYVVLASVGFRAEA